MKYTKGLTLLLLITLLSTSFFTAHAAGGRIEGKVTDPKGAAIPAATVIITNQITKQDFTTVSDGQGKYKVEGLPAGTYIVRVSVKGFNEGRREDVSVEDDDIVTIDVRLEIAPVEAEMLVPIYVDVGKGWRSFGSARINGNSSVELKNIKLPAVPKRVAVCALHDVLATSIENSK